MTGQINKLKRDAAKNWRVWAEAIADGGKPPAVLELLEAAAVLQIREPMAALEADALAINEVRDLELRAQLCRDRIAERTAPFGGAQGVRDRINELKAELRKLEGLVGITATHHQAGQLAGEASRLRAKFPRVFGSIDDKPARKAREEALV
jgi:hypothetical protein